MAQPPLSKTMRLKFKLSVGMETDRVKGMDGRRHEMRDGDVLDVPDPFARDRLKRFPLNYEVVEKAVLGRPDNRMINPGLENK